MRNLPDLQKQFSFIGDVRGKGLLIGLEFVKNLLTKEPFSREEAFSQKVIHVAFDNGLLLYPAGAGIDGIQGDAIIISPPLTITIPEIDELIEILTTTFQIVSTMIQKGGSQT